MAFSRLMKLIVCIVALQILHVQSFHSQFRRRIDSKYYATKDDTYINYSGEDLTKLLSRITASVLLAQTLQNPVQADVNDQQIFANSMRLADDISRNSLQAVDELKSAISEPFKIKIPSNSGLLTTTVKSAQESTEQVKQSFRSYFADIAERLSTASSKVEVPSIKVDTESLKNTVLSYQFALSLLGIILYADAKQYSSLMESKLSEMEMAKKEMEEKLEKTTATESDDYQKLVVESDRLHQEIENLTKMFDDKSAEVLSLNDALQTLQNDIDVKFVEDIKAEVVALKEELAFLKSSPKTTERVTNTSELEEQLKKTKENFDFWVNESKQSVAAVKEFLRKNSDLPDGIVNMVTLTSIPSTLSMVESNSKTTQKSTKKGTDDATAWKKKYELSQKNLKEKESLLKEKETSVNTSSSEYKKLQESNEELKGLLQVSEKNNKKLESDLQAVTQDFKSLKDEFAKLRDDNSKMRAEVDTLSAAREESTTKSKAPADNEVKDKIIVSQLESAKTVARNLQAMLDKKSFEIKELQTQCALYHPL